MQVTVSSIPLLQPHKKVQSRARVAGRMSSATHNIIYTQRLQRYILLIRTIVVWVRVTAQNHTKQDKNVNTFSQFRDSVN